MTKPRHTGSLLLSTGWLEGRRAVRVPGWCGRGARLFCGSGKWLIRSVDVRGQVDRAGLKSRPAVPSRARVVCPLVGDELAVDDIGEPSLQVAQRFHRDLVRGELASVVGAALGVATD